LNVSFGDPVGTPEYGSGTDPEKFALGTELTEFSVTENLVFYL